MAVITAYYKYSTLLNCWWWCDYMGVFPQIFKICGQNKMALWSFGNLALN